MIEKLFIKSGEEVIIRAVVYLLEFNNHACTDVQLSGFVLGIAASGYVTAPTLKFGAELFLG